MNSRSVPISIKANLKTKQLGMVGHAFNSSTRETEECRSLEFQVSQGYVVMPCLKKRNNKTNNNKAKQMKTQTIKMKKTKTKQMNKSVAPN